MKLGKRTVLFDNPPSIIATGSIVGPMEAKCEFGKYFDERLDSDTFDEKSYEKAEKKFHIRAIQQVLFNAGLFVDDIDLAVCGDLLNQITVSSFAVRNFNLPFIGVYNACASFGEAMYLASSLLNTGDYKNVVCCSSSHFSSAERQYRFPLELGNQRTPTSQWTVTGAGSVILSTTKGKTKIKGATLGSIVDYGVTDVNNMGAAMAPAVYETLKRHFADTGRTYSYYDKIITGDLGKFGTKMLRELFRQDGIELTNHEDCGALIYGDNKKAVQGGSGAGCCSVMFGGYYYKLLQNSTINRILFMPTGALLSKDTSQQGETIPSISHAIIIENED